MKFLIALALVEEEARKASISGGYCAILGTHFDERDPSQKASRGVAYALQSLTATAIFF